MKIKKIHLSNFKCFKDSEFEFSDLNIITGANSSGKSSLFNGILSVLQSEDFPFSLSANGKYIDMGSFEEISFKNNKRNNIAISGIIESKTIFDFTTTKEVEFKTVWKNSKNDLPVIKKVCIKTPESRINISLKKDFYYLDYSFKLSNVYSDVIKLVYKNYFEIENFRNAKSRDLNDVEMKYEHVKFTSLSELNNKFINNISAGSITSPKFTILEYFISLDRNFNFIGSFRAAPQRTYYRTSKIKSQVTIDGNGYLDQIMEWEENNPMKFKALVDAMTEMNLATIIKCKKLPGGRVELTLKPINSAVVSPLSDVGFGISQFLPILVADLQLEKESILMMSQPEIHLHTEVQAKLANYLVSKLNSEKKQYFVETHSEYFLNRIRLLISNGKLNEKNLKVYYLENNINGNKVHEIKFLKNGQIKNAPKSFFETYLTDILDIALNAKN